MGLQIFTLGCRLNQADSEEIKENFASANGSLTNLKNICIVNTCCVTKDAEVKSKKLLRKIKRNNPHSLVIATGCLVKANKNNIFKNIPADLTLSEIDFNDLESNFNNNSTLDTKLTIHEKQETGYEGRNTRDEIRVRRFVKIQDGCNRYCAFCVVPFARSKVYSRSPQEILKQIENLTDKNIKEVVLTAACLGLYNYSNGNNEKINLAKLIKIIDKNSCIKRLRLTSIDPEDLSDEFINNFSQSANFCSHLHLSIQSGSDKILKLMKRNYTQQAVIEKVNKLKKQISHLSLSADILIGFPEENDKDFQQTIKLVKELNIHKCHIFTYSDRPNTSSSYLKSKIPEKIKKHRAKEMEKISLQQFLNIAQKMIGTSRNVLVEEKKEDFYLGYTEDYFKIKLPANVRKTLGEIVRVELEKVESKYFLGK